MLFVCFVYFGMHYINPFAHQTPQPYPQLMELLSNEDVSDVITWLPHGKGFAILKKNKFAAEGKLFVHMICTFSFIRLYIPSNPQLQLDSCIYILNTKTIFKTIPHHIQSIHT